VSRSHKRRPHASICGRSQKRDKRIANRCLRRTTRVEVAHGAEIVTTMREAANVYNWSQDGTRRWWSFAVAKRRNPSITLHRWRKWAVMK
jgi:hypothetical protein